jgi:hypothetical protein
LYYLINSGVTIDKGIEIDFGDVVCQRHNSLLLRRVCEQVSKVIRASQYLVCNLAQDCVEDDIRRDNNREVVRPRECQVVQVVLVHQHRAGGSGYGALDDLFLVHLREQASEPGHHLGVNFWLPYVNSVEGSVDDDRLGNVLFNDRNRSLEQY